MVDRVEKLERQLQEFSDKRDLIGRELMKTKEEMKQIIDNIFDDLFKEVSARVDQVDTVIEASIKEFKSLMARKKELDSLKEKFHPIIQIIQEAQGGKISNF